MSTWDDKPNVYDHALKVIEGLRRDLEIWRRNGGDDIMRGALGEIENIANIPPADNRFGSVEARMHKIWLLARGHQQGTAAPGKP